MMQQVNLTPEEPYRHEHTMGDQLSPSIFKLELPPVEFCLPLCLLPEESLPLPCLASCLPLFSPLFLTFAESY